MIEWELATALAITLLVALTTHLFYRRPPAPLWPALPLVFGVALVFSVGDLIANLQAREDLVGRADTVDFDEYQTNERLHKALELKLFEDQKDSIKLTSLVSQVVDQETQAKIDVVKQRLIDRFGYDEHSATDVLNYVASIFARGDATQED